MGSLSIWHWLILLAVVLLFFGGSGKISAVMTDFAKGIKGFKKGLQDDAEEAAKQKAPEPPKTIEAQKATETPTAGGSAGAGAGSAASTGTKLG